MASKQLGIWNCRSGWCWSKYQRDRRRWRSIVESRESSSGVQSRANGRKNRYVRGRGGFERESEGVNANGWL